MLTILLLILALFLQACSPDYSGTKLKHSLAETAYRPKTFSLYLNGEAIVPSENLILAYTKILPDSVQTACQFSMHIEEKIQHQKESLWYIGLAMFVPFWPALPVNGNIVLKGKLELICDDILVQRLVFIEEEDFEFFWYGVFREKSLMNRVDWVHEKLIYRLQHALELQKKVDEGIIFEF